jgi:hypothetical protein
MIVPIAPMRAAITVANGSDIRSLLSFVFKISFTYTRLTGRRMSRQADGWRSAAEPDRRAGRLHSLARLRERQRAAGLQRMATDAAPLGRTRSVCPSMELSGLAGLATELRQRRSVFSATSSPEVEPILASSAPTEVRRSRRVLQRYGVLSLLIPPRLSLDKLRPRSRTPSNLPKNFPQPP